MYMYMYVHVHVQYVKVYFIVLLKKSDKCIKTVCIPSNVEVLSSWRQTFILEITMYV